MIIGIPREIKDNENRVSITPGGVEALCHEGHTVLVEAGAGEGSLFSDDEYAAAGARVLADAAEVWQQSGMILKVKEPLRREYPYLREGLLLFTYLHLAATRELTDELTRTGVTGIAYETVERNDRSLPLLIPMSMVAGRMAIQVAACYLEKINGGRGKLLGGIPGVRPADVVIVGGGTVGTNAAQVALGMGAHVTVIDKSLERLEYLEQILHGSLTTLSANLRNVTDAVRYADVVIGAVLVKGAKTPHVVTRKMVETMKAGSVIVDVSVDQGGCVETTHPTTHSDPTFFVGDVLHYCVANMPGAVPRTATFALSNATLPYAIELANRGFKEAVRRDPALAKGVNVYRGQITYPAVAETFGLPHQLLDTLL